MESKKIVYYHDENNDDFIKQKGGNITINEKYRYLHSNWLWNVLAFVLYRLVATPIAYIYMKLKFRVQFIGKEKLKQSKEKGYFLYINHTQMVGDALLPTLVSFAKKAYVIVHPYNVSMPIWGKVIRFLGPLPLPNNVQAWKNFNNAIEKIISKKQVIAIYPEAHVWNYYTKIRNYSDASFRYPIKNNADSYAVTVTYQKNRWIPKMVVYIDGPFTSNHNNNLKEQQKELRDKIYFTMCERSENSNMEYIKYEKIKEEVHD